MFCNARAFFGEVQLNVYVNKLTVTLSVGSDGYVGVTP